MKDLIKLLKLPPTYFFVFSIVSGCTLFLPQSILDKMGFSNLQNPYNMILGCVFLISTALLLASIIQYGFKTMKQYYIKKKLPIVFAKNMNALSDYEKSIVYLLSLTPNLTFNLPMHDGSVLRLESKLIIQKTSSQYLVDMLDPRVAFTLTNIASDYLKKNKDFFESLPCEYKRESEQLVSASPNW